MRQSHDTHTLVSSLMEHGSDFVWELDAQRRYCIASAACFELLGYRPEEMLGRTPFEFMQAPYRDKALAGALSREEARQPMEQVIGRYLHKQGFEVVLESNGYLLFDDRGTPRGWRGITRDVTEHERTRRQACAYRHQLEGLVQQRTAELENTIRLLEEENRERRQAEKHLIEAKEEAEQANRLKSEFLSRVSHELRTPMNAILGFSQLLEQEALDERQRDYNREILGAGRHLLQLIDEVLDLSAIEAGRLRLDIRPVPLAGVLQESLALVRNLALGRQVSLHDNTPPQSPWLRADPVRLKEVLVNLLNNAIKYNRSGGAVHIDCHPNNTGWTRVSIRDNGVGVRPEHLARLFAPFDRLDAEYSKIEGTGIGLSIVKALIEQMGGKVGVCSMQKAGTTFWFELRSAPDPAPAASRGDVI